MDSRFVPIIFASLLILLPSAGTTQEPSAESPEEKIQAPDRVEVADTVDDSDITERLESILKATGWFETPSAAVHEGVVFLGGSAREEKHREWAGALAQNTEDVVAVVNEIDVTAPPFWDLSPAVEELGALGRSAVRALPSFLVGLLVLVLAWLASRIASVLYKKHLTERFDSRFLAEIVRRAVRLGIIIVGVFLALRISGLTGLAVTVLGGTGLIGLALGFAFRDIAENFLASILIGLQRPFRKQDRIQVAGHDGFVQSVNTRATLLMTLDGNHVQIPNATVYKDTITNFTANPNSRFEFLVGIGYTDNITQAQSIIRDILQSHPAVVKTSDVLVLVDSLGAATINLKVIFWINVAEYSGAKVRSAVIRMSKTALEDAGISMPDEAREVVFPDGVPIRDRMEVKTSSSVKMTPSAACEEEDSALSNEAEGELSPELEEIETQAKGSKLPEGGESLIQ